jgi:phosphohistidine phosphatase
LLRHAEAEDGGRKSDFERVLTKFGRAQAKLVGEYLKDNNIIPDLILCSDAVRTKQTLELANEVCHLHLQIRYLSELYNAHTDVLEKQLFMVDEDIKSVMLIGHNPAITMLPLRFKIPEFIDGINDLSCTGKLVGLCFHKAAHWSGLLTAPCQVMNLLCPQVL